MGCQVHIKIGRCFSPEVLPPTLSTPTRISRRAKHNQASVGVVRTALVHSGSVGKPLTKPDLRGQHEATEGKKNATFCYRVSYIRHTWYLSIDGKLGCFRIRRILDVALLTGFTNVGNGGSSIHV